LRNKILRVSQERSIHRITANRTICKLNGTSIGGFGLQLWMVN